MFEDYGIVDCKTKDEAQGMNRLFFNTSKITFDLDGRGDKISRFTSFKIPDLLASLIGSNKDSAKFNKLNHRKLPPLERAKLDNDNHQVLDCFPAINEKELLSCPVREAIETLQSEVDQHVLASSSHGQKQAQINDDTLTVAQPSEYAELKHVGKLKIDSMLNPLIKKLASADDLELTNVREHENQFLDLVTSSESVITLASVRNREIKRNNLRKKYQNNLLEGLPVVNVVLCRFFLLTMRNLICFYSSATQTKSRSK